MHKNAFRRNAPILNRNFYASIIGTSQLWAGNFIKDRHLSYGTQYLIYQVFFFFAFILDQIDVSEICGLSCDFIFAEYVEYQLNCKSWTFDMISTNITTVRKTTCVVPPVGFIGTSTMSEMCPQTCSHRNRSLLNMYFVQNYSTNHTSASDAESFILQYSPPPHGLAF